MNNQWRPGKRIAVVGAGPGGVSAALAFQRMGFDVRLYERSETPKPLGGAVLLNTPVLAVLRYFGIDLDSFGAYTVVEFRNNRGKSRAKLPFNKKVEQSFGIKGWHYGMLRKNAFARMMELLPENTLFGDHELKDFVEQDDQVTLNFSNGESVEADILIGADGVHSRISNSIFPQRSLFHVGLRVWLCWCDHIDGIAENLAVISHSDKYQASFFPMLHDGKPGYEWWVVEPVKVHAPVPAYPKAYLDNILKDFVDPMPRFSAVTDFSTQCFPWDIYNHESLQKWSKGRVVCIGDAAHPVSPYSAYGMGMAIEDGYFLARALQNSNLSDATSVATWSSKFEQDRVDYVNHQVEFARTLGRRFHHTPNPLAWIRDFVFDHTGFLQKQISEDYLRSAELMSLSMKELHVN